MCFLSLQTCLIYFLDKTDWWLIVHSSVGWCKANVLARAFVSSFRHASSAAFAIVFHHLTDSTLALNIHPILSELNSWPFSGPLLLAGESTSCLLKHARSRYCSFCDNKIMFYVRLFSSPPWFGGVSRQWRGCLGSCSVVQGQSPWSGVLQKLKAFCFLSSLFFVYNWIWFVEIQHLVFASNKQYSFSFNQLYFFFSSLR